MKSLLDQTRSEGIHKAYSVEDINKYTRRKREWNDRISWWYAYAEANYMLDDVKL